MTILTYEMGLDHSYGVMISNADAHWEEVPTRANFENPPISVHQPEEMAYEEFWKRLALCASSDFSEEFWEELNQRGYTDSVEDLHAIHLALLRGELSDWKLVGVSVTDFSVRLAFVNPSYSWCEVVYLEPGVNVDLHPIFKVNEENYYEIVLLGIPEKYAITVTEHSVFGKRDFRFGWHIRNEGYGYNRSCRVENRKIYVEVTEYR